MARRRPAGPQSVLGALAAAGQGPGRRVPGDLSWPEPYDARVVATTEEWERAAKCRSPDATGGDDRGDDLEKAYVRRRFLTRRESQGGRSAGPWWSSAAPESAMAQGRRRDGPSARPRGTAAAAGRKARMMRALNSKESRMYLYGRSTSVASAYNWSVTRGHRS